MSIIFVDVDGVLNTFSERDDGFIVIEKGFKLNLRLSDAEWLLKLAENTNSELVWGSTWQNLANECVGKHIGLPEMPHLTLTPSRFSETLEETKAKAALAYAKGSKFVFFDDLGDIANYLKVPYGLLIQVHPNFGLNKGHMEKAERFLNS